MSGDTPSPSPKEVSRNNTSTPHRGKAIKDCSLDIEFILDDVIEMPQLDLENLMLEKIIFLQEILVKKKRQEELRREHQQKQVLHDVKDIFVEALDIKKIDGKAPIISHLLNIFE